MAGEVSWARTVDCKDGLGRPGREMLVFLTQAAEVGVKAPPGEVGVLPLGQVQEFQQVLTAARVAAATRKLDQPSSGVTRLTHTRVFTVMDQTGAPVQLAIGLEDGVPRMSAPRPWHADPDTYDQIGAAMRQLAAVARRQRES